MEIKPDTRLKDLNIEGFEQFLLYKFGLSQILSQSKEKKSEMMKMSVSEFSSYFKIDQNQLRQVFNELVKQANGLDLKLNNLFEGEQYTVIFIDQQKMDQKVRENLRSKYECFDLPEDYSLMHDLDLQKTYLIVCSDSTRAFCSTLQFRESGYQCFRLTWS